MAAPWFSTRKMEPLLSFLKVPSFPRSHWSNNSGWIMSEFMYTQVKDKIRSTIATSNFFALSVDEATACDNTSWLSMHIYTCEDWVRVPYLLSLRKIVECPTANHLTEVVMSSVEKDGGVGAGDVAKKMLCFGADGAATFQGLRSGVTTQIQRDYAPYSIGVHYMAHQCNLAFKMLSGMGIFQSIEKMLQKTYSYFSHSPRRLEEFFRLANVIETKGLKLLQNVETRWVSLIDPMRRLLAEYRSVLGKAYVDRSEATVSFFSIVCRRILCVSFV
jgi:hypothetical protein